MSSNGSPAMPVRNRTLDRRSKVIRAAQAAFLVAIISAFLPTLAHAQPIVLIDERPFAFVESNPCLAGELVSLTGRFITKGQGTALTSPLQRPKEYVFSSEYVEEMNAPASGTVEQTVVLNHILIRKSETDGTAVPLLGTGDDFMMKDTVHFTIV